MADRQASKALSDVRALADMIDEVADGYPQAVVMMAVCLLVARGIHSNPETTSLDKTMALFRETVAHELSGIAFEEGEHMRKH